ncbi:MAG TPA: pantetheine-phosphate adenylyltransferase [Candidatus Dormibacteraeota bacterium]|nr:pantetheine-phosphate adenylyltransferase [Candidatus Dormibacteraeota bacterium]
MSRASSKLALYPATFDPFTNGHLDVLERARLIFDKVVVGVLKNPAKSPLFSEEERLEMIRETLKDRDNVEVSSFHGLTVDYAREIGAGTLVRGLRSYSDFDTELQLALMNRKLAPDLQTIFLMSSFAHIFVSSSTIKDIASYGRDVGDFVPPAVAQRLKEKFK